MTTALQETSDLRRFFTKVNFVGPIPQDPARPIDTSCWIWTAGLMPAGYGSFWLQGETTLAHRVSYEHFNGPLPERQSMLWLDHACRIRRCVNPDHLDLVTPGENQIRAQRPYCRNGHEYTPENTIWVKNKKGEHTQRLCRTCTLAKYARFRERRRSA